MAVIMLAEQPADVVEREPDALRSPDCVAQRCALIDHNLAYLRGK